MVTVIICTLLLGQAWKPEQERSGAQKDRCVHIFRPENIDDDLSLGQFGQNIASAGNRTRINCLEGSYADHYTTDAVLIVLLPKSQGLGQILPVHGHVIP